MSFSELVEVVPELLLLVVPGFISLRIKEKYCVETKKDSFDSSLYCIFYSFIIGIVYSTVVFLFSLFINNVKEFFENESVKSACYLLLSFLFGLVLVHFPKTTIGQKINKSYNKNLSSEPTVWMKAMQNEEGAWATVYLKNGMIYTGKLINYSTDPNDEKRSILLYNYRLSVRNEGGISSPSGFCRDVKDNTEVDDCKVFLDGDNIISIEIEP